MIALRRRYEYFLGLSTSSVSFASVRSALSMRTTSRMAELPLFRKKEALTDVTAALNLVSLVQNEGIL